VQKRRQPVLLCARSLVLTEDAAKK